MKQIIGNGTRVLSCALASLLVAGCAQQQQQGRYRPSSAPVAAAENQVPTTPAPAVAPTGGYGVSYARFDQNGRQYVRGSMAFPTGLRESSGLLVQKTVPAEVLVGERFEYIYEVSNLTEFPLQDVTLTDHVTPNFQAADANPKPAENRDGVAIWNIGNLGAKETRTIRVQGSSAEEGSINTCGWATYSPVLCEDIRVVKAALELVKTAPAQVVICDPIPMTLTVRNSGSSALTGVKIVDTLPAGLSVDGQTSRTFDAGDLAPGARKEFKFNAIAAKTGEFVNNAQASSTQGVKADATAKTVVVEPVLEIACVAPEERFMGREFDVCFTVVNKGNAPSVGTIIEVPVPAGLTFKSATAAGRVSDGKMVWDVGTLPPNAPKELCAKVVSENAGTFRFNSTAKGACAKPVSTTCQTVVVGISALLLEKADDPDPIEVNATTTYTVKVTNQGTADDTNVRMVVEFPAEISPVSASNNGKIEGKRVTFPPFPRLQPKQAFTYTIQAKGDKPGDARVRFIRTSDGIPAPTTAEESTRVY